jgi:SARP family transcriptional regulator, regulator of embCAB operon
MLRFNVLGNLEIVRNGYPVTPSPPKVRRVLALVVLRANQVVHPNSLIEELWGQSPPKSAMTTLQTYIYHLRKLFAEEGLESPGHELLLTRPPGYTFKVPEGALDADVFSRLAADGYHHIRQGNPFLASSILRDALNVWSGPALANVSLGSELKAHAVALEEQRIQALQLRIQADMEMGRHHELIGELKLLTAANPLDEWFARQLIIALGRSGRRSEALDVYQEVRETLRSELGLDPSSELQQAQRDVLRASSFPATASAATVFPAAARPIPVAADRLRTASVIAKVNGGRGLQYSADLIPED